MNTFNISINGVDMTRYAVYPFNFQFTLDDARLCDMSETNFRRRFLEVFGETPFGYRDGLRIIHAKDYLSGGYYTVTETAEKCGFTENRICITAILTTFIISIPAYIFYLP